MTPLRFRLGWVLWLGLFLATGAFAQSVPPARNTYGPLVQGQTYPVANTAGSQAVSFEYLFNNTPASVSITIQGCMRGTGQPGSVGTCDTAVDTYTGTSNSIRSPSFTKVYDTFLITVGTLSAGTTLTVNTTVVVSKAGTSSGGGGGSGTVTNTGGALANNFVMLGAGGNDSKTDTALSTNGAGSMTDTQGSLAVSTPLLSHTATWNAGAVAFTDWLSNITCTAAATGSIALGLGTAGTQWQFKYNGANCGSPQLIFPNGTNAAPSISFANGATGGLFSPSAGSYTFSNGSNNGVTLNNQVRVGSPGVFGFTSTTDSTIAADTSMSRDAADSIDFGNGTAGNKTALVAFRHANQGATNDYAGVCSGTTTTCAVTFTATYTSTPACVVTPTTAGVTSAIITTQAATGFTVTYAPSGTTTFNYICVGNPN